MKEIDTILVGATALALPIAHRLGGSCLVVDEGISAAPEFSDAMDAAAADLSDLRSEYVRSLADELSERNIMTSDGRLHILAAGGVFAKFYLDSGCTLLLNSAVTSVSPDGEGMLAAVFTPERGFEAYHARRVIDTRVRSFMDCRKTYGLLLAGEDSLGLFDDGGVYLQKGLFPDEYVLRFRVDGRASIPDAQRIADDWLCANLTRLGRAKLAGTALAFGYEFDRPVDIVRGGIRYIPSAAYGDILSAAKGGASVCL